MVRICVDYIIASKGWAYIKRSFVLKYFCIPLEKIWISDLMRDFLKLFDNKVRKTSN